MNCVLNKIQNVKHHLQIKFNKTIRLFANLINFKVPLCDSQYKI